MTGGERGAWEAEGLLAGLDTEEEREGRRELLDRLHAEGCSVDELRRAVEEDRVALLPVEKMLLRDRRLTMRDVVEQTGMSKEYVLADRRAMGLPDLGEDEPAYSEDTLDSFRALKFMLEAGISEAQLLELTRLVAGASSRLADAALRTFGQALIQPGTSERDLGLRMVDFANALMPHVSKMLQGPFELHLAEIVKHEAIGRFERERGVLPGARPVAICFADMVGFTRLSEQMDIDQLGEVQQRFSDVAGETAVSPVRLVKTIGDEAMLASEDPAALVEATLALVSAAERDDLLPPLRAGGAAGNALRRAGDYYGRPVNLAARITAAAPEGGLLADEHLREAAGDGFDWTAVGTSGFKGIDGEVELYRAERSAG
jgi:adenylate cyclase